MVGVYADGKVHGGICAVIDQYLHSSIAENYRILLSGNSSAGSSLAKTAAFIRGCFTLAKRCAFGRVSLVHLHTASGTSFYRKAVCFLIAKIFRKKTIVHIHGGGFLDFYATSPAPIRMLIRIVLDRADAIIVLSERFHTGIGSISKNPNLHVVFNPISSACFGKALTERTSPRFLFVGDVIERKGVGELMAAMKIVLGSMPAAHLTICGAGRIDFYRRVCEDLHISDAVTFSGFVSGEAKLSAFSAASLFVLPSWVEGMPMVIIEAMAAGLPVVATPVGGIPEVIEDGINGFLVPARDAAALAERILRIAADPALGKSMSAENIRKVKEVFDISVIAEQVCGIYEKLIQGT